MDPKNLFVLVGFIVTLLTALIGFFGTKAAKRADVKMKQLDTLSSDEQEFRKTVLEQWRISQGQIRSLETDVGNLRDKVDLLQRELRDANTVGDVLRRHIAELDALLARASVACTCGAVAHLLATRPLPPMPPPTPTPAPTGGTP